ncbi:hypothetical protein GJ496_000883 [Pomphorhynchus laevis]|nr:hypothetical protein GJ496_000883 [Pomphorhynchus laevis]
MHVKKSNDLIKSYDKKLCNAFPISFFTAFNNINHYIADKQSCFIPFVLTAINGVGQSATNLLKSLARKFSQVHRCDYADVINDLRARISVSLARAASTCLLAPRSGNGAFQTVTSTKSHEGQTCHSVDFGLRAEHE